MLQAHEAAGSFLEQPLFESTPTTDQRPAVEKPGTRIGPYKLLQLIGEGGMGSVWMAEQSHPVQRKVALKIIKAGMDSRHVLARFEAERQALALMDHPHIAKVLDAGSINPKSEIRNPKVEEPNSALSDFEFRISDLPCLRRLFPLLFLEFRHLEHVGQNQFQRDEP